ncbi:type II secretion system F family protein [Streptomyces sp. NPDC005423]|uniref:type II secretion system F family protein n=1 Tax=Streptomyces sp. NPDC005423 TaxID=3155343 RepID=UPI0033ADD2AE
MSAEVVHRLWVGLGVVLALGWFLRGWEDVRRERRARRRLTWLLVREAASVRAHFEVRGIVRRWMPVVGVVSAGWALVGGVTGVLAGAIGAVAWWRWNRGRTTTESEREYDASVAAQQLPLAADLLAACIAAGASPVVAAQAVGEAIAGPVGERLARGAAEIRLGGEPGDAWRSLASVPGAGPLARLLERADESGLPTAGPVARLAADTRADWTRTATARARRAAVLVTAPVGLCFLPAFIAVGVLPVVIGLAGGVRGAGIG